MLILVTGATGYIASRLIPRLLERGHRARILAREPRRLDGRGWSASTEIFAGDVTSPSTLRPALEGVHTAYYLIHNMSSGRGYTERELTGARNFTQAAAEAGVKHIIYLGGLANPEQRLPPHMRSRIETGKVLREGKVPVTEFRAGVIVGSGSISFEMIRFMTELFPVIPGPRWLKNKSQPIAVQNVIDYLLAALDNWDGHGQIFEIGGPEITTYADLMLRYARLRGHQRRMLLLPYIPVWFMALGIDLVTPVPRPIAHALVGGLGADSVVLRDDALRVFPEVKLLNFDAAAREALTHLHPSRIERVWESDERVRSLKHEGFFILHGQVVGWNGTSYSQSIPPISPQNNWQVEINDPSRLLLHRSRPFGEEWLEYAVGQIGKTRQSQTASPTSMAYYFAPRGLWGFAYWYLLYPFHTFAFRRLVRAIARKAKEPGFSERPGF